MSNSSNKIITADEARELMRSKTPEYWVEKFCAGIKQAAANGHRSWRTYDCDFGSGALYSGKPTELQQCIIDKLTELGFKAYIMYEERQFVDIYLKVEW